jgi:hypothetical protein
MHEYSVGLATLDTNISRRLGANDMAHLEAHRPRFGRPIAVIPDMWKNRRTGFLNY